ncbi:hypothetical protein Q9L58_010822, partial [Maublancomyces gigas]
MPPKGKGTQVPATPKQQQRRQVLPQTPKQQQQKQRRMVDLSPEERLAFNNDYMTPSKEKRLHILNPDGTPQLNASGEVTLTDEAYQAYLEGTNVYTYLRESDPNPEPGAMRLEDYISTPYVPTGTHAPPSHGDEKPFVPIVYQRRADGSVMRDHRGSPIHAKAPPHPTPTDTFKGPADDRPSPKTPTRRGKNTLLPSFTSTDTEDLPSDTESEGFKSFLEETYSASTHDHPFQHGWEANIAPSTAGPSTPPSKPSVHFTDPEATPKPIPRASEPTYDSEMSEAEFETVAEMSIAEVVTHLFNRIKKLERASKIPPPPTKYHNDPALVEKLAILTTKVAELEKTNLLRIIQAPAPPPATGRPPPGLPAPPPPPTSAPKNSWTDNNNTET